MPFENGEKWTTAAILRKALDHLPVDCEIMVNRVDNLSFFAPGKGGRWLAWLDFAEDKLHMLYDDEDDDLAIELKNE